MNERYSIKLIFLLLIYLIHKNSGEDIDLKFPDDFLIGVASSAYQTEGAWNDSDKGESDWDSFVHNYPEKISNRSNGDVASDSFHKFKDDVQLLHSLEVNHYRFSLSWTRLLPTGYTNKISKIGVQYYHSLLDELEKYNITPVVTIYHFDLPQSLENFGGWLNERTAYAFADYAKFVFQEFGHRVKYFVNFNEIWNLCSLGYNGEPHPPGLKMAGTGDYLCAHNALKAHALAYHIYDKEFRTKQNGLIGVAESVPSFYNKNGNDTDAKDITYAFTAGWILNPIFSSDGNYPEIMIRRVAERSKLQGLEKSRLPIFCAEWIDRIRGSADFLGLIYYTGGLVEQLPLKEQLHWPNDSGTKFSEIPTGALTEVPVNKVFPKGFGDVLRKMKDDYNNPLIFVLENGVAVSGGLNDNLREEYLYLYLKEMFVAMKRDKCNVKMYTYWSLLDSFEWARGYSVHFGLAEVDYESENRTRTLKKSAVWIKSLLKSRKLQPPTNRML